MSGRIEAFELDNGRYPSSEQGLRALVEEPTTEPVPLNWKGPYLQRRVPQDPWGSDYVYRSPGSRNLMSYDLLSVGPDQAEGSDRQTHHGTAVERGEQRVALPLVLRGGRRPHRGPDSATK